MYQLQRKLLSQNFLYSRKLVSKLVGSSSIAKNDLVLEIGPGKGIITESLINKAGRVITVEIDENWANQLKNQFRNADNLAIYQQDILNFSLPKVAYKVFANIPFSIEGKIIRKLIDSPNPPDDCYLVINKQLANRLSAPYKENLFSITHKPFFDFKIYYQFRKTDFTPMTSVDSVLFRFTKKHNPLISNQNKFNYEQFVIRGFGQGLPVYKNLLRFYDRENLNWVFNKLNIHNNIKPSYLSIIKWIQLFNLLNNHNIPKLNLYRIARKSP